MFEHDVKPLPYRRGVRITEWDDLKKAQRHGFQQVFEERISVVLTLLLSIRRICSCISATLAEPRGRGPRSGERCRFARRRPAAPAPLPQASPAAKVRAGGAGDRREPRPAVRGHEDRRAAPFRVTRDAGHRGRGRRSGRPPRCPGVAAAGTGSETRGRAARKSPARCRSGCVALREYPLRLPPTCT